VHRDPAHGENAARPGLGDCWWDFWRDGIGAKWRKSNDRGGDRTRGLRIKSISRFGADGIDRGEPATTGADRQRPAC
jgi:hypothetical protein